MNEGTTVGRIRRWAALAAAIAMVGIAAPVAADDAGTPAGEGSGPPAAQDEGAAPTTTIVAVVIEAADDPPAGTGENPDPEGTTPDSTAPQATSVETGSQSASVSGTAVAIATTGGNVLVNDAPANSTAPSGSGSGPTGVATGPATAIGSQDSTTVTQGVVTALTGSASASVSQVVIVFNIGAALAVSGANGVAGGSAAATGGIGTGSSSAVGNASSSYVTQAATAAAGAGASDTVDQDVDVSSVGVAVASSGGNLVVSVLGGGAAGSAVSTGGATAVGNQSTTGIQQTAAASGSGSATISIDQRAFVLNLGIALANSGLNSVGGLAEELLANPTGDTATGLMTLLLPGLVAATTAPTPGPGGAVSTGSATAIGNRSTTLIDQSAVAAATDDGSVSISQQVVVANVGAAFADSGSNAIGAAGTLPAGLDADAASVAAQLGAFVAGVLAAIDGDDASGNGSVQLALGELLVMIDSAVSSTEIDVAGSSDGTGPSAKVRQKTIVISLGASRSVSGQNTVVSSTGSTPASSASDPLAALPEGVLPDLYTGLVTTGDATAENEGLVIVCQLEDAIGYICLVPRTPDEGPAPLPPGSPAPDDAGPGAPAPATPGADVAPAVAAQPAVVQAQLPTDLIAIVVPLSALPAAVPASVLPAQDLPTTGGNAGAITMLATTLLLAGAALVALGAVTPRRRSGTCAS